MSGKRRRRGTHTHQTKEVHARIPPQKGGTDETQRRETPLAVESVLPSRDEAPRPLPADATRSTRRPPRGPRVMCDPGQIRCFNSPSDHQARWHRRRRLAASRSLSLPIFGCPFSRLLRLSYAPRSPAILSSARRNICRMPELYCCLHPSSFRGPPIL